MHVLLETAGCSSFISIFCSKKENSWRMNGQCTKSRSSFWRLNDRQTEIEAQGERGGREGGRVLEFRSLERNNNLCNRRCEEAIRSVEMHQDYDRLNRIKHNAST